MLTEIKRKGIKKCNTRLTPFMDTLRNFLSPETSHTLRLATNASKDNHRGFETIPSLSKVTVIFRSYRTSAMADKICMKLYSSLSLFS